MSDIETSHVFAGMTTQGIGGIDGDFMKKNGLLVAAIITTKGEAAIMVHPQFNFESAPKMVELINHLHRQSVEVLQGASDGNGQVH